jgi:hypothetical protein
MLAEKGTKIEMEPNETFLCASLDYSTKCNLRPTFTSLHKFLKTYKQMTERPDTEHNTDSDMSINLKMT